MISASNVSATLVSPTEVICPERLLNFRNTGTVSHLSPEE